ncbi:MAG: DNA translocase FtsK [Anaerolineales bacterium]|nr:DNA translocase FtsK [Anaerolineales bacterium]MCS7247636.1 DNA translocase FtsK [Anaerolineales bacterium]MDW8161446.1 DNA translocase FtsK [Anaerolineales bacterium]MDW8445956.1 DNA translocase FtsK [Anaerolineales bacterium]
MGKSHLHQSSSGGKTSPEAQRTAAVPPWALARFRRFGKDIGGLLSFALAAMTLLGILFPPLTAGFLAAWTQFLRLWFGWGSLWIVVGFTWLGLRLLSRSGFALPPKWGKILAWEAVAFCSLALLGVFGGIDLGRAEAGLDGGRVGWGLARLSGGWLLPLGLVGAILHGLLIVAVLSLCLFVALGGWDWVLRQMRKEGPGSPLSSEETDGLSHQADSTPSPPKRAKEPLPKEWRKELRVFENQRAEQPTPSLPRDERLPPLSLLMNEPPYRPDERNVNMTAALIEKTLGEFGIPARVVGVQVGPTITQFAVEPGFVEKNGAEGEVARQKVRVAQISALSRDLALALAAERLRIEAPVPGRPYIGIEVPNPRPAVVRLRPLLESEAFAKVGSPLALALGRDVSGNPVVGDLARMPHLLIAGTTGSGKSVSIAAITTCLAMNNTPQDLRLIMIDPKMVELVRFNGLPHLMGKVETKIERILGVLRWTVSEMERRYKVLEATRSRNIETHNKKARRQRDLSPLPYLVVIIDELADLMMIAAEQTEHALIRLAQMARATGIHLIVATQRPSTDVVTGLIKANFPARIAFAVASAVDSRVILDNAGAETLLGHGDMLFLPPDAVSPIRCQGVMVNDVEIERLITFWQSNAPSVEEPPPWEEYLMESSPLEDHDALLEQAIQIVRTTRRASASLLQRRLRIGYPRAARLMDELEAMGVVGPLLAGSREREVLLDEGEDSQAEER